MKLKVGSTAMVVAIITALIHAAWISMVFLGVGQVYLNWVFGLHLLSNPFVVQPFNLATAISLIIFTYVVGYILGWVFAITWNWLHKSK